GSAKLGRAELPHPHLLPRGRQGRPLRRLGRARAIRNRDPRGVPDTALAAAKRSSRFSKVAGCSGREGTQIMSTETAAMNADPAVQRFHVDIADEAIADLRRRTAAWRPPEREPVDDQSQGVQLATVRDLANYWATEYDWRRCEAELNALPQFRTEIDGVDIHFIHSRSPQQNALPLIVSHGWPGSIIEQ